MQEAALRRGDRDRAKGGSKRKSMKGLPGGAQAASPAKPARMSTERTLKAYITDISIFRLILFCSTVRSDGGRK